MESQNEMQGAIEILGYKRKTTNVRGGEITQAWCQMKCHGQEFELESCKGEFELPVDQTRKLKDCGCGGWEAVKVQKRDVRKKARLEAVKKLKGGGSVGGSPEVQKRAPGRPIIPLQMKKVPVMFYLRNEAIEELQKFVRANGTNMSVMMGALLDEFLEANKG